MRQQLGLDFLILLDGNSTDELRVVLPPITFDPRESLEYASDGRRFLLSPVALLDQTADYEVARYRQSVVS